MAVSFLFRVLPTLYSCRGDRWAGRGRAPPITYFSGVARLPQAMTVPVLFGAARM